MELGTYNDILAQNKLIFEQMEELKKQIAKLQLEPKTHESAQQLMKCELCVGEHQNGHYCTVESTREKELHYMNEIKRQNNYSNN